MKFSDFNFLGYRVSKVHFEMDDGFEVNNAKFNQEVSIERGLSEENKRFVEVRLNVKVISESKLLRIEVEIKGGFQANPEMPDDLFEKISMQNCPAILFPLVRAIIASYSSQANIPAILLPLVSFADQEKI